MKKLKNRRTLTQAAIFAGATALMALTPNTRAQTSVDNLLNKLEQKGILTPNEADELKAENATNSVADFNQALNSKFPMPDWITGYKLSGDFRGRFDERTTPNPAQEDNARLRYRLRVGLQVNMKDNLQVGLRLGSDDANSANGLGGAPLSNTSTFQGNGTKKFLYIDAAYGKWTPINDDTWMVAGTIGKMDEPFLETPMVFDADYTPEGGALQATYQINDENSVAVNGAGFVLAYSGSAAENMSFLYGAQVAWNSKWTSHIASSLGVAAYNIVNRDMLTTANAGSGNKGNSVNAAGDPIYNLNPIVADASLTYTLDGFPLYKGAFPIKLTAEYLNNPGAPRSGGAVVGGAPSGNEGYYAGITFGRAVQQGTWDIGYRYESLDANAWYAQIVNDDNQAYNAGFAGGTNVKGHLFTADYALTDALLFSFTCYVNSMIGNTNPAGASSREIHAMADLMWKF
ncbi:MAG TPA: putative porin [Verrucomicrobiae bacterium]|nr:putative porin [Verrucomicrobiae bacterium]